LEYLEVFSSNQFLFITCFGLHPVIVESIDENERASFVEMMLEKLLDVVELNFENEQFYYHYYCTLYNCFRSGLDLDVQKQCLPRTVNIVWHGVIKHKYDEEAQAGGRAFLRFLVGAESAKEMIDHAEMHHCEDEDCAGCA
jgi:hypothetical protein